MGEGELRPRRSNRASIGNQRGLNFESEEEQDEENARGIIHEEDTEFRPDIKESENAYNSDYVQSSDDELDTLNKQKSKRDSSRKRVVSPSSRNHREQLKSKKKKVLSMNNSVREEEEDDDGDVEAIKDGMIPMPKLARDVVVSDSFLGGNETLGDQETDGIGSTFVDISSNLMLKKDHVSRPVWVAPDGRIFLETFSPIYRQAYDFLVAIAEPVSRPELVQEYRLTPYALYAAVSVGLDSESIISVLSRLCKTELPKEVPKMIRSYTRTFGKAKIVLHKGKYFLRSNDESVLKVLLKDSVVQNARVMTEFERHHQSEMVNAEMESGIVLAGGEEAVSDAATLNAVVAALEKDEDDDEDEGGDKKKQNRELSVEIMGEHVEYVKRRCIELDYPLMEEYDFRHDTINASLDMDLKPIAKVRPYQEKSLAKMFGNGRARSGVIVLPCGAGKSLVGVTAACTVKKPCLCLCTSSVSVEQWRHQFALWSTLPKEHIGRFTAGAKGNMLCPITVTTYSMISHSGKRAPETMKLLEELKTREWGLILLDEVHVVPANVFRRVLGVVKAHCKLGLTATLLREDHKIGDINFLIGPKLYEANWIDLQRAGYLATVQCAEVWCPMTAEFYREYLTQSASKRKLLYAMNPNKFRMCQYLVRFHEARGDKVIIFSDNIFALRLYATKLKRPFIYGPTSQTERIRILYQFQNNPELGTILLSKVGDTSIDIPEANVLIQVSSHYGSRRQEAQRLGRILRPKPRAGQNFNAYFYSLVSSDTQEMYYSSKRQQFLVDQGYAFKVITHLDGMDSVPDLEYTTREEQLELLQQVLIADDSEANERIEDLDADELGVDKAYPVGSSLAAAAAARRRVVSNTMGNLSGVADGSTYAEFDRAIPGMPSTDELLGRRVIRHSLFRKRFGK
eukprot:CAMPEP_0182443506 /NCGR_PEP_ID=MMETSP1172-20130603/2223_1 /TAXON_ID=708627 /ORGANISM="Timspurckia oligopyrenoides, Strain CCMP3278" /LENGTH=909 /DNA_ID=CAMNT_0024638811 /DNA_START=55 /DNA_END=2784 /DNA_ORIENTATION=+